MRAKINCTFPIGHLRIIRPCYPRRVTHEIGERHRFLLERSRNLFVGAFGFYNSDASGSCANNCEASLLGWCGCTNERDWAWAGLEESFKVLAPFEYSITGDNQA